MNPRTVDSLMLSAGGRQRWMEWRPPDSGR